MQHTNPYDFTPLDQGFAKTLLRHHNNIYESIQSLKNIIQDNDVLCYLNEYLTKFNKIPISNPELIEKSIF